MSKSNNLHVPCITEWGVRKEPGKRDRLHPKERIVCVIDALISLVENELAFAGGITEVAMNADRKSKDEIVTLTVVTHDGKHVDTVHYKGQWKHMKVLYQAANMWYQSVKDDHDVTDFLIRIVLQQEFGEVSVKVILALKPLFFNQKARVIIQLACGLTTDMDENIHEAILDGHDTFRASVERRLAAKTGNKPAQPGAA